MIYSGRILGSSGRVGDLRTNYVDKGKDPLAEREAEQVRAKQTKTIGDVAEAFLKAREGDMKPRSYVECTRHLRKDVKELHGHPIKTVHREARIIWHLAEMALAVSAQ